MEEIKQNKLHIVKDRSIHLKNWILDHTKIVMPAVLVVCVLITIFVALNANQKEVLEKEAQAAALAVSAEGTTTAAVEGILTPSYELEENAYPEVNAAVKSYYDAQASGDIAAIEKLNPYLDEIELIRVQEMSKYIEGYPELNVYTKPGLSDQTYVAYVYSEVKFVDEEQPLPGLKTYYIGQNEDGSFYINDGSYDETITKYIGEVTLQDDVVDLNNKVVVEYNDLLAEDSALEEYVAFLKEKINEDVGEILAQAEAPIESLETEEQTTETTEAVEAVQTVVTKVKATDVVNVRSSDSENADKIGKAQIGQEFTLLEQKGNGWSKVEYEGSEAYIKSDYLEAVEEKTIEAAAQTEDTTEAETETVQETTVAATTSSDTVTGSVTVKENVKIRAGASTTSESYGTAYVGQKLDLIVKQSDGWTKISYKGNIAYVKSDYVE